MVTGERSTERTDTSRRARGRRTRSEHHRIATGYEILGASGGIDEKRRRGPFGTDTR